MSSLSLPEGFFAREQNSIFRSHASKKQKEDKTVYVI